MTNTPPTPDTVKSQLDEILEGYYIWMTDVITDSFKLDRILGTGKAPKLKPSEAKARLQLLLVEAKLELLRRIYKQITTNDVAGPVKWEVSDLMEEVEHQRSTLLNGMGGTERE